MQKLMLPLILTLLATTVLADSPTAVADLPEYRIGIEDVLDVAVWNVAELQKTVPVRPDGKISLPLVNDVVAAGPTPRGLGGQMTKENDAHRLEPDASP